MKNLKLKRFEESIKYEYIVCEVDPCEEEGFKLSMTETRFVDFCEKHYNEYILEKYEDLQ